ncbi:MAG: RDD family protein [Thermodesulfobacteriota bacterium]
MRKAGIFARLIAFIIDGFVLSLFAGLITFIIALISDIDLNLSNEHFSVVSQSASVILAISLTFLEFIYFGFLWGTYGKSVGMSIFDIKVVRTGGDPVGFWRAGLRGTIGYWISGLIFGLGYIWALFDTRRQAWHDKLFDTLVVKG